MRIKKQGKSRQKTGEEARWEVNIDGGARWTHTAAINGWDNRRRGWEVKIVGKKDKMRTLKGRV